MKIAKGDRIRVKQSVNNEKCYEGMIYSYADLLAGRSGTVMSTTPSGGLIVEFDDFVEEYRIDESMVDKIAKDSGKTYTQEELGALRSEILNICNSLDRLVNILEKSIDKGK